MWLLLLDQFYYKSCPKRVTYVEAVVGLELAPEAGVH